MLMDKLMSVLAVTTDYDSGNNDITSTMQPLVNSFDDMGASLESWAARIVMILGVIGLAIGVYTLVSNLISKAKTGREKVSWAVVVAAITVGAVMLFGGWRMSLIFGGMLQDTVSGIIWN